MAQLDQYLKTDIFFTCPKNIVYLILDRKILSAYYLLFFEETTSKPELYFEPNYNYSKPGIYTELVYLFAAIFVTCNLIQSIMIHNIYYNKKEMETAECLSK